MKKLSKEKFFRIGTKKYSIEFDETNDTQLDTDEVGDADAFIRNIRKVNLHRSLLNLRESATFLIKDKGFHEESEVRLLSMYPQNSDNVKYRSDAEKPVPYIPYKLPRSHNTIKQVILGPKNKPPIPVVESMLKRHGFGDVDVTPSSIPYQ